MDWGEAEEVEVDGLELEGPREGPKEGPEAEGPEEGLYLVDLSALQFVIVNAYKVALPLTPYPPTPYP